MSRASRLLTLVAGLIFLGCGGGGSSGGGDAGPPALASTSNGLDITSSADTVEAGDELTFKAVRSGTAEELVPTWSVTTGAAYIDARGRLLAFEPGVVEVKGDFGGTFSGTRQVNVTPALGSWPGNVGYGGTDNEGGKAVAVDAANNVYVAGAQARGLAEDAPAAGGSDAFVARFLPNGKRAWTHTFGEPSPDFTASMVAHPKDGVIVAYAYGGGSWIVHLDARGKEVWKTAVGNTNEGAIVLADLALGSRGDLYAVGSLARPNDIFKGATDGVILHYDTQGTETWRKTFNETGTPPTDPRPYAADPTAIAVDEAHGELAVSGIAQISYYYGANAFARGFDLQGNPRWCKYITSTGVIDLPPLGSPHGVADIALDVAIGKAGEIYVGGVLTTADVGSNSPFLVRFSALGAVEWSKDGKTTPELIEQVGGGVSSLLYRPESNDLLVVTTAGDAHHIAGNYVSALMTMSDAGAVGWRRAPKAQPNARVPSPNFSLRGLTRDAAGLIYFVGDTAGDWGRPNPATAVSLTGTDLALGRFDANGN